MTTPMVFCTWCGGSAVAGSTCPRSIACPSCATLPGCHCHRPSGHDCDIHAARWQAAEEMDAAIGLVYEPTQMTMEGV